MRHEQRSEGETNALSRTQESRGNEPSSGKRSDQQAKARQSQFSELLALLPSSSRAQEPSDVAYALVADLEEKGTFPDAHYVLAERLLTPRLAKLIESVGKHWVGQLEGRCPIQWEGPWLRLEQVAEKLREESPQSFRSSSILDTHEVSRPVYIFSRSVRLDHYGRKRIVIMHGTEDLSDPPLFLFIDALFWEGRRIVQMWQYRWEERMFL